MKASQEHFGNPALFEIAKGVKYIGMLTRILADGQRMDASVMFTNLGYGWENAKKPWRVRFKESPDITLLIEQHEQVVELIGFLNELQTVSGGDTLLERVKNVVRHYASQPGRWFRRYGK